MDNGGKILVTLGTWLGGVLAFLFLVYNLYNVPLNFADATAENAFKVLVFIQLILTVAVFYLFRELSKSSKSEVSKLRETEQFRLQKVEENE